MVFQEYALDFSVLLTLEGKFHILSLKQQPNPKYNTWKTLAIWESWVHLAAVNLKNK